MEQTYKNFKVGQSVKLNTSIVSEDKHFDSGHNFSIISFPPCVISGKYKYFVYGKDNNGFAIRCNINQIIK